ncbi:MAG: hypothetical protein QM498_01885, partial [Desulfobacterium sp.]
IRLIFLTRQGFSKMPTYLNNTSLKADLSGPHGERFTVLPGETIEVPFFVVDANFTQIAVTPLPSVATATTPVVLTETVADHALNASTRRVKIAQITGSITVRPQLDTATPLLLDWTADDGASAEFHLDDFPCSLLRVSGSGMITIMEYNR